MALHLNIIGTLMILLALMHLAFPRYFKWRQELASLSLINRQVMYVHTFFLALLVMMMGLLSVLHSRELIETKLGRTIAAALSVFWVIRLFFQFFVYSPLLWKGKRFETFVHVVFTLLWTYFSIVFFLAWLG